MYRVGYGFAALLALVSLAAVVAAVAMGAIRLGTGELPPDVQPPAGVGIGFHGQMSPAIGLTLIVAASTGGVAILLLIVLVMVQALRRA